MALRRSVALLLTTGFGVWAATRFPLKGFLTLAVWVTVSLALLSLVFIVALPRYGVHPDGLWEGYWRGVFMHKNGFGKSMGLGAVLALGLLCVQPKGRRAPLVLTFLLLAAMTVSSLISSSG